MSAIQFTAVVGPDGVIRPPEGVVLPRGEIEVEVRACTPQGEVPASALTFGWLLDLAAQIEAENPNLPSDMAENHDHYAHGAARR